MSRAKFDWIETLSELAGGRKLGEREYANLARLAGNWPTCACGQLCKSLPRDYDGSPDDGSPDDDELEKLGMLFYHKVVNQEWCKALTVFYKIETRTVHLLKQQMSKEFYAPYPHQAGK